MESLIHADIFFFITTIIAIILGILLAVVLSYIIKILADIKEISNIARVETTDMAEDIHNIRDEVRSEFRKNSSVIASLFSIFGSLFRLRKSRISKSKK